MRTRTKTMLAALAAAAMMFAVVAHASARELRVNERAFEILFERGLDLEMAGNNIDCPFTLLGSFINNPIRKVINSDIGWINHVAPNTEAAPPCTGGTYTVLQEKLPWLISYQGFQGRLPNITAIRLLLIGAAMQLRTSGGILCLFGSTARSPWAFEALVGSGGRVEGLRAEERTGIPLGGGFLCEISGEGHFAGTGTVTRLPGVGALTVTLI